MTFKRASTFLATLTLSLFIGAGVVSATNDHQDNDESSCTTLVVDGQQYAASHVTPGTVQWQENTPNPTSASACGVTWNGINGADHLTECGDAGVTSVHWVLNNERLVISDVTCGQTTTTTEAPTTTVTPTTEAPTTTVVGDTTTTVTPTTQPSTSTTEAPTTTQAPTTTAGTPTTAAPVTTVAVDTPPSPALPRTGNSSSTILILAGLITGLGAIMTSVRRKPTTR